MKRLFRKEKKYFFHHSGFDFFSLFFLKLLQYVEDSETGDVLPKATKKKPPKIEESKSKKEHVNVVFIGHVGKFSLL
jgi:hypothetical protein